MPRLEIKTTEYFAFSRIVNDKLSGDELPDLFDAIVNAGFGKKALVEIQRRVTDPTCMVRRNDHREDDEESIDEAFAEQILFALADAFACGLPVAHELSEIARKRYGRYVKLAA